VLSEQQIVTSGRQPPYSFSLPYDPTKIAVNGTYIVQANIRVNGQLRYTTTTAYRVITGGSPTTVNIVLDAVGLPNTSGGSELLVWALALAALLLGIRLLRPRLLGAPSARRI
jgi:hypothetical protein